ncbi:MAG: hypothetical protein ACYDB5_06305 [bacterium]
MILYENLKIADRKLFFRMTASLSAYSLVNRNGVRFYFGALYSPVRE